jgi:alcohol dehydrogenase
VTTVRALVYHGPAQSSRDTVQDSAVEEATDAIVRVDATTVCGK